MRRKITLPDGRSVSTTSTARYQVVTDGDQGLRRANSNDQRGQALRWWRHWARYCPAWMIDMTDGHVEREPADNTGSMTRP